MAYSCFNCGKKTIKGTQHRHRPGVAGRQHYRRAPHTTKSFKPNLQTAYLIINSQAKKVKLCTKCRRLLKKQGKIRFWSKEVQSKEETVKKTAALEKAIQKLVPKTQEKVTEKKGKVTTVEELVGKKS